MRAAGIDLGAGAVHVVVTDAPDGGRPRVEQARVFVPAQRHEIVALVRDADAVAIDAPAAPSTAPHRDDPTLSAKFRTARCGEIALGVDAGIWVPWTTPTAEAPLPGWMAVGFEVWRALRDDGHVPMEVYPSGVFRVLAGTRAAKALPKKTTVAGLHERIALLREHVAVPDTIEVWSHDGIDALAAAVVASGRDDGRSRPVGHRRSGDEAAACDGSAIWLPVVEEAQTFSSQ